ncbi:hypothetical protein BJV74DRAFT_846019 [Russula compacta]|nr:hypothetical protein BJV74DRAFT_846019 [Russula compacta]
MCPPLDLWKCNRYRLPYGQGSIDHVLHEIVGIIYLALLLRNFTITWVKFLPVLLEVVSTIASPGANLGWTMD